ncbi:COPII coat assembly protein like [Actinidia chinensis var. chinensis]|uniref:COPII coat assembly protein like n=1 Tax=Actinidia chinensis var. chinensis TaxID=1590841 RepID=A0A2R6QY97_ACTCC|nr:COPII coat assembly protein like [Actinidia chinensis var. chinensis]
MAFYRNSSFLLSLLLITSLAISGKTVHAARVLLETRLPKVPDLSKPELPPLPTFPTLPEPKLPPLPKVEVPLLPHVPTLPKPEMPELPPLPHLPNLAEPTLPSIPALPKDIPIPSLFPPHSATSP